MRARVLVVDGGDLPGVRQRDLLVPASPLAELDESGGEAGVLDSGDQTRERFVQASVPGEQAREQL